MRHFTHISPSSNLFSGPSQMGEKPFFAHHVFDESFRTPSNFLVWGV